MKKVINGKIYDTEKSELVGEYDNGSPQSDFEWWSAALYRTPRSKSYFLAGEGGAMTQFSRRVEGNSWTGGSKIIPLEKQEALEWAERYLSTEIVEHYFTDMIEG